METNTHNILDVLDRVWPYVSGVAVTILATVRLWWHDKKVTKARINTLEVMAEHMVTKDELQACRDDVREEDESNLEKIYKEIKENNQENARQHQDILKQVIRLHSGEHS